MAAPNSYKPETHVFATRIFVADELCETSAAQRAEAAKTALEVLGDGVLSTTIGKTDLCNEEPEPGLPSLEDPALVIDMLLEAASPEEAYKKAAHVGLSSLWMSGVDVTHLKFAGAFACPGGELTLATDPGSIESPSHCIYAADAQQTFNSEVAQYN